MFDDETLPPAPEAPAAADSPTLQEIEVIDQEDTPVTFPARNRRQGRAWALQLIVQADLNPFVDVGMILSHFWEQQWSYEQEKAHRDDAEPGKPPKREPYPEERLATHQLKQFTEDLVRGTLARREAIDAAIARLCDNWSLERLGVIERSLLRLAFYEMDWFGTPAPVVINEAVDLAKFFANEESGAFVNGVLDRHAHEKRA